MHRIRTALMLSAGLAVASCGDSSTEPEDSLTGAEALALLEVAMSPGFELTDQLDAGNVTANVTTLPGDAMELTIPCSMGGTVTVGAQLNPVGDPGGESVGVGAVATLVHSGCVEAHETSGITFTLDGAPEVEMTIELSISPDLLFEISGTVDGTVRWATDDGRRGICGLDVDLDTVSDPSGFPNITLTGRACGAEIMESMPGLGLAMG